ncbi:glycoside hydrolase family 70 protein [Lactobacillaceae bacterium Scapto_B20]
MNSNNNKNKLHYKMYKSGKKWIIAGIFTITAGTSIMLNNSIASADTVQSQNNTNDSNSSSLANNLSESKNESNNSNVNTSNSSNNSSSASNVNASNNSNNMSSASNVNASSNSNDSSSASNVKSSSNSNDSSSASNVKSSSNSNDSSSASNVNASSNSNDSSSTSNANASSNSNDSSSTSNAKSSSNSNDSSSTSNAKSSSNSNDSSSTSNAKSSSNSNDSSSASNVKSSSNSNDSSSASNAKSSSNSNNISSASDSNASSSSSSNDSSNSSSSKSVSNLLQSLSNLSQYISNNASSALKSHIKQVDGKYYYYNDNNIVTNSMLINDNGNSYYFDQNGQLIALTSSLQSNSGTISANGNTATFSDDGSSITNVSGFLTANTWYRPKQILNDGTNWQPSNENDYRPLLSVWWPDKQTEVNYLNYMNSQGLSNSQFTNSDSQDSLNTAAESVRANIEKKISANNGDVNWLKDSINSFIDSQDAWNKNSENQGVYGVNDNLQGGFLLYGNNQLTPDTNSDYRLINRAPTNKNGSGYGGTEFLLANDVDNSNPVVQAEDLNWLYYLTNFGSIVKNDPDANFDSIRIDAVNCIDSDLLSIAGQYFRDAYGVNKNDKNAQNHLSILEDWSSDDQVVTSNDGSNQLVMDYGFPDGIKNALGSSSGDLNKIIIESTVNRLNDSTSNTAIPNYSFIRAHDSYIVGNNFPSAYSLLLTNKDTVPRVFYGDLYSDTGQYMKDKTINYDAITTLMENRRKYVSGGQSMNVQNVDGTSINGSNQILTSVRYGYGANNDSDLGNDITRTSGIATVVANNPSINLSDSDKISINMGAAHKNQSYRPLIMSNNNGVSIYNDDSSALNDYITTDDNGNLVLTSKQIKGVNNQQVQGYLSVWVPVGAKENQDVRTLPSDSSNNSGKVLRSNDSLDSHILFEGFANPMAMPNDNSEKANVIISQQSKLFNQWGITDFQMAPQYVSSTDNSFVDSQVQNGYAFTDRYDLGISKSSKYGTVDDLVSAIKSLHAQGIKVMADFVPNQLYSMPEKQVVSATRVDGQGKYESGSTIYNYLYLSNSLGSGNDLQSRYGGEFLNILKNNYPDLFSTIQSSTGKTIDSTEKIKQWSAKYFNGTNVQGRGAYYVLRNSGNYDYFVVPTSNNTSIKSANLPKELYGNSVTYGLTEINGKLQYLSTSGYNIKDSFIKDSNNNSYYFDKDGNMVTTPTTINGLDYYFLPNGINLRGSVVYSSNGKAYYYQQNGTKFIDKGYRFIDESRNKVIFVNDDDSIATGLTNIYNNTQYFNLDGTQVKGSIVNVDGNNKYFDSTLGNLVKNSFFYNNNNYYYSNNEGNVVTGAQDINGNQYYFGDNGIQVKNSIIVESNGTKKYYDSDNGNLVLNQDIKFNGITYHADNNGVLSLVDDKQTNSGSSNTNNSSNASNNSNSSNPSTSTNNSIPAVTPSTNNGITITPTVSIGGGYVAPTTTTSSSSSSSLASSSATSSSSSSASSSSAASSAISSASSSSATNSASSSNNGNNVPTSTSVNDKIKAAKSAMNKAQKEAKVAEKLKNKNHNKTHVKNYNKALDNYYQAEYNYLKIAKLHNGKYYYDFDKVTKHSKYVKLSKSAYVYDSKKFNKENRVSKVKKGTKVKVNKIVRHGKTTRFNIGHNKFITGLKSFIHKLSK